MWPVALLAALALAAPSQAGVRSGVWFLRAGEPVAVDRAAPGVTGIVRLLLAGPTTRERAAGIASAIPAGTPLRELRIERRVVTVDLGARFASGRDGDALTARVGQLVRTLRSVPGVLGVRIRIEGGIPMEPSGCPRKVPGCREVRIELADG